MSILPPDPASAIIQSMNGLFRGLNHALSNRVNTLNTLLAVLQESTEFDPEVVEALAAEEAKFEALLALYRLMPMEREAAREPMVLTDPLKDATALFAHHLDLRMHRVEVLGADAAPPVRSQRQFLTQTLLVLMVEVGRSLNPDETESGLRVEVAADGDYVAVKIGTDVPVAPREAESWAGWEWMAQQLGGQLSHGAEPDGRIWVQLSLLSLAAERKKGR